MIGNILKNIDIFSCLTVLVHVIQYFVVSYLGVIKKVVIKSWTYKNFAIFYFDKFQQILNTKKSKQSQAYSGSGS